MRAFLQDTVTGKEPRNFDTTLVYGKLSRNATTTDSVVDLQPISWIGSMPLPEKGITYLQWNVVNQTGTDLNLLMSYSIDDLPGGGGYNSKPYVQTWIYGVTHAIRQVYTQENAAGGDIIVDYYVPQGTEFIIEYLRTGNDDYAAGRAVTFQIVDEDGNVAGNYDSRSVDNQKLQIPNAGTTGADNNLSTLPVLVRKIGGSDKLRIIGVALAQNETLTITLRARTRGEKLKIDFSNSTGTVNTPTTTINRIIGG